jgi:RNA recognition motif-containing protein
MKHCTLFVGNITFDLTEAELKAAFEPFGDVAAVRIIRHFDTGASRGFAFVEMGTEDAAAQALSMLDGKDLSGRTLKVAWAKYGESTFRGTYSNRFKF